MTGHSVEELHGIAESLGLLREVASTSQLQLIRSIRQIQNEAPCFATEKNYCCGKDCEWREDCRAMMKV